jgi:TRAP transporter TAXI family solute receptor
MKTSRIIFVSLLLMCGSALASPIGIASGNTTGTNWPMAENIKKYCSTPQAPINNVVSDGSLDNIFKIYGSSDTQYGIIQTDALAFQAGRDPAMMKKILMVFPFFSTEFHLVAKDGSPITSLAQLAGKRVVEGPEGSGTWVTVQVIKALTGIQWTPVLASQQAGLDQVRAGTADAEFIVAGVPVGMLKDPKNAGIKLIPIQHQALDTYKLYTKTMVPNGTYPFQKAAVSTYKVDNVLATFAFKNQYQKEIGELVTCITKNLEVMQRASTVEAGHPKWRDVSTLDIDRIQWPAHPAAVAAIKRELKLAK